MLKGGAAYVRAVEEVLAAVSPTVEGFPSTLADAYENRDGDSILAGCAIEIAEGNEEDGGTPADIASRAVWLMHRVRDDVDNIIAALESYTGEMASAETRPE